ncbi:MAG: acetoin utilization protein [Acidocella sp. 20-57-95]|nr:MAG: acetoin utilization protein [Acidocella sp. 20-57-95]OYV59459.1 MAG: acetoin utilization protein [Acidocella sp. 21-58-7]HQT63033.1 histone deacetylase family protein [Acidocella sp.]HQU03377.1 histone deacetylase family protein [Acidocella sp.]
MKVALFTHPVALAHDTGEHHPECADRVRYLLRALETQEFSGLLREIAPIAPVEALEATHSRRHVEQILDLDVPPGDIQPIDADTFVSSASLEAARRSAGGAMAGVDAVMEGWANAAFVAMRPPGHHAEADRAMGFCLFNNAAVAAYHARARWGLQRIAVVDFDVHHGNGTQDIFWSDKDLFYASSHQHPCYPGTGMADETGVAGNIVNMPLAPGSGGDEFRVAWGAGIIPKLRAFKPQLLIISAGFDAHAHDPLAQLRLREPDFAWVTEMLLAVADECCEGRVVSLLEGGYDLDALAASAAVHVKALMRL